MTQFNFTTNIEKRMPQTGKVYCIDRMTSDYAEQHPLDVDGFIESVYQEFAGTEFEESRETLRSIWTAVLSVTNPCGDASIYPNKNGAKRAAAMKVWAKAGDYWRRGLRQGDILPDMVPMTKITRIDGGWIALFQKDAHLLNSSTPGLLRDSNTNDHESRSMEEPRQLDLFAQLQQENEVLQARIAELERQEKERQEQERRDCECASRFAREEKAREEKARQRRERQRNEVPEWKRKLEEQWRVNHPYESSHNIAVETENNHAWLKTTGYVVAASVALLVIWQTGLIIPLGLIGLATSGLMK